MILQIFGILSFNYTVVGKTNLLAFFTYCLEMYDSDVFYTLHNTLFFCSKHVSKVTFIWKSLYLQSVAERYTNLSKQSPTGKDEGGGDNKKRSNKTGLH